MVIKIELKEKKLLKERKEEIPKWLDLIENEICDARRTNSKLINTTEKAQASALIAIATVRYVKLLQSME